MTTHTELDPDDIEQIATVVARKVLAALQGQTAIATAPADDRMLSEPEASAMLGVERWVLRDARKRHELEFHRLGNHVRYDREQIERWKQRNANREVRRNGKNKKKSA